MTAADLPQTGEKFTLGKYNKNFGLPIQPIAIGDLLFWAKNVEGIVFYTADTDYRRMRKLKTIGDAKQLVSSLIREEQLFTVGISTIAIVSASALARVIYLNSLVSAAAVAEIQLDRVEFSS